MTKFHSLSGGILLEDGTESDQKTVCVNAFVYLNRQKVVRINKEFGKYSKTCVKRPLSKRPRPIIA